MADCTLPATEKVYLHDTYLQTCSSVVLACTLISDDEPKLAKYGSHQLILDRTVFHPQGGGQPSDVGVITANDESFTFNVTFTTAIGNHIVHVGHIRMHAACNCKPGVAVNCSIDINKRAIYAKLHSAGHSMDAAMTALGIHEHLRATKGYHFLDGPYVEYEGNISEEVLKTLAADLNRVLAQLIELNIPTEMEYLTKEDAGIKCKCDTSTYPEEVRVITLAGCSCPCGGTHVRETKELGSVTVTKIKKKKNTYKVSYVVE